MTPTVGSFEGQTSYEKPVNYFNYWFITILGAISTGLVWVAVVWRRGYRKHYVPTTVVPWYEPYNDHRAILIGTLVDGKVNSRDITAGILSLARDGYIKLEKQTSKTWGVFSNSDWLITVVKPIDDTLLSAEKGVVALLFGRDDPLVGMSKRVSQIVTKSNASFKQKIVERVRATLATDLMRQQYQEKFWGGTRWTQKGYEARNHIQGFKLFLSVTEKDRYAFHNAPDKSPEQFMRFLPYAIALHVEKSGLNNLKISIFLT